MISLVSLDPALSFPRQLERAAGPVLLVITYAVPAEAEAALMDLWAQDTARMAGRPGFVSARRYRGQSGSRLWHTTAEWESPQDLLAALNAAGADVELQAKAAQVPDGVIAYPHLFELAPADEVRAEHREGNQG